MTRFEIYYNYRAAERKADDLDKAARKLERGACDVMQQVLSQVRGEWQGDAANAFISKGNELVRKMRAEAASLRKAAQVIRRIAKRIYDTEMRALELSRKRTY